MGAADPALRNQDVDLHTRFLIWVVTQVILVNLISPGLICRIGWNFIHVLK
jgi:hypothetical protein